MTEQPIEDVLEQQAEVEDAPSLEPLNELPAEADEADVVDQHRVVPVDEREG